VTYDEATGQGFDACDCPSTVDAALDGEERGAGTALLYLVLDEFHPACVVLPRVKRGLRARDAQIRANALQSLGHFGRLHRMIDEESVALLRRALRDRTRIGRYPLWGYAGNAADDIATFVPRHRLPRWFRRRHAGPRRPRPLPRRAS
jgi:hypothetical protein